jgi:hypothetical protein
MSNVSDCSLPAAHTHEQKNEKEAVLMTVIQDACYPDVVSLSE